jgi:hypothetical protein
MAMPGPPPSENRRRRNADTYADVKATVVDDGELVGPALEGQWSDLVRSWWDTWRRSPQAKAFLATDWMRLRMIAPLLQDYLAKPTALKMAEIRQNESLLGATYTDRLKARIKVEKPAEDAAAPAGVTALNDYRTRLQAEAG